MSNRIDLFGPDFQRLALPAAGASVFVEGALRLDLEPVEIVRSGWPEFSWARLACHPAAQQDAGELSPERIEDRLTLGTSLRLCQLYNGAPPAAAVAGLALFAGQIEGIETTIGDGGETVEIVAKDFSAVLGRITVYGRRVLLSDGATVLLPGLDTVFNPLGQGNATAQPAATEGRTRTFFCAQAAGAGTWNCAQALDYLLSEYVRSSELYWPDTEQLLALTEAQPVRDLDVTGLSLLEALQRCCQQAGLQFHFAPRLADTGPSQALVFSRGGRGRCVELNCQQAGESLSLACTSVGSLHSRRDLYPITHRYLGQGDFKVYEATFELVQAWDPALEDTDYDRFCAATNPDFHQVRDVYRRWCLNEAGDYSGAPFNRGEPFDFAAVFEHAPYVRRRRRFWPALSTDTQGKPLGYFLQVSYDDGLHWWTYLHAFNNLLDECGVWLSSDHLDVDTWIAALKAVLRVRITASVVSDARLTCIVADGPLDSTIPVVDHLLTLPRQFQYRKVSPQSVLAQASGAGFGAPDEVDDGPALHQLVRRRAGASPAVIETAQVRTISLALHLHPGDRVMASPESRDLLHCRRDQRSTVWIDRVHIDFRNQCTNLRLIRRRGHEG